MEILLMSTLGNSQIRFRYLYVESIPMYVCVCVGWYFFTFSCTQRRFLKTFEIAYMYLLNRFVRLSVRAVTFLNIIRLPLNLCMFWRFNM